MTKSLLLSPFLLLVFCLSAFSQTSAYRLGSRDVISVIINAGGEEQARVNLPVSDQGEINVPFIGSVRAAGLTIPELEKTISTPLEEGFFVDPQVILQVAEYHSLSYTISGAVGAPGKYELDFHPTIMDLIAKAKGVLSERGDIAYIMSDTKEKDKDPVIVDLSKLLDQGDMSCNITLQTGDKVYIPLGRKLDQSRSKIFIEGEIKKPGTLDYQPGLTALAACIMAGGFDKFAAPNRAKVIRQAKNGPEIIKLNLDDVISGELPDLPLKPGDRIHIPESWL